MLCLIVKGPPDWWRYQAIVKPVCCVWSWQRRNEGWQKYSGKSGTLQDDDLNLSLWKEVWKQRYTYLPKLRD